MAAIAALTAVLVVAQADQALPVPTATPVAMAKAAGASVATSFKRAAKVARDTPIPPLDMEAAAVLPLALMDIATATQAEAAPAIPVAAVLVSAAKAAMAKAMAVAVAAVLPVKLARIIKAAFQWEALAALASLELAAQAHPR